MTALPAARNLKNGWNCGGRSKMDNSSRDCCGVGALGAREFRRELLARMSAKAGPGHSGEEIRESAEEKAQRLVGQELKKLGWEESELSRRRKGDKRKIKIVLRLRRKTTMTLAWIAQRLYMGSRTHLNHLLYWQNSEKQHEPRGTGDRHCTGYVNDEGGSPASHSCSGYGSGEVARTGRCPGKRR